MSEKKPRQVTIKLEYPVDLDGGATLSEITIRRPKAGDMAAIEAAGDDGKMAQGMAMLSVLTGLTVEVLNELDLDDFTAASEKIADFFPQAKEWATGAA